jgi:hypothetical protein
MNRKDIARNRTEPTVATMAHRGLSLAVQVMALLTIILTVVMLTLNVRNYQRSHTPLRHSVDSCDHKRLPVIYNPSPTHDKNSSFRQKFSRVSKKQYPRFGFVPELTVQYDMPFRNPPKHLEVVASSGTDRAHQVQILQKGIDSALISLQPPSSGSDLCRDITLTTILPAARPCTGAPPDAASLVDLPIYGLTYIYRGNDGIWAVPLTPPQGIRRGRSLAPSKSFLLAGANSSMQSDVRLRATIGYSPKNGNLALLVVTDGDMAGVRTLLMIAYEVGDDVAVAVPHITVVYDLSTASLEPVNKHCEILPVHSSRGSVVVYDRGGGLIVVCCIRVGKPPVTVDATPLNNSFFTIFSAIYDDRDNYLYISASKVGVAICVYISTDLRTLTMPKDWSAPVAMFSNAHVHGVGQFFLNPYDNTLPRVRAVSIGTEHHSMLVVDFAAGVQIPSVNTFPTSLAPTAFTRQPNVHYTHGGTYCVAADTSNTSISLLFLPTETVQMSPYVYLNGEVVRENTTLSTTAWLGGPNFTNEDYIQNGEPEVLLCVSSQGAGQYSVCRASNIGGIHILLLGDVAT